MCLGQYPEIVGSLFPQLQSPEDFIRSNNCLVKLIRHSCRLLSKHLKLIKMSPFFPFRMCLEKNLLVGTVQGIKHRISYFCSLDITFYKIATPQACCWTLSTSASSLCEYFGIVSCKQDGELLEPCLTSVIGVLDMYVQILSACKACVDVHNLLPFLLRRD